MRQLFIFISLSLAGCSIHHKEPADKIIQPAPVKQVIKSPQIVFSKVTGEPTEIPVKDLDNFLREKYHLQRSFEKELEVKMKETEEVMGEKLLKRVDLQNEQYNIHYEYFSGYTEPTAVKLIINDRKIDRWLWESSNENQAASDLTLNSVYTFHSNNADYLVITGNNLQAVGKFSQITFGLLINLSNSSLTAKVLTTYSNPGRFFFNPNGETGRLKYLTAYPLDNDDGELAAHLSVQVNEIVMP
ncbi:hypothetical protein QFZ51_003874 [Chitinophaga sp. W3I9]|uniref:hypothetical protein n=1 Tax=unclassified Chitinophaga TaxID=2619133 RepID=UPI003D2596B9